MLLDKGFYDYDYEPTEAPKVYVEKSGAELKGWLAGFGIGTEVQDEMSDEEIQEHIINQIKEE